MIMNDWILFRFIRWCPGAVGIFLRQMYLPRFFAHCGKKVIFGRFFDVSSPEKISIGDNVIFANNVCLNIEKNLSRSCQLIVENNVFLGTYSQLVVKNKGKIVVKNGANISSCCYLFTQSELEIGTDCLIAAYCKLGGSYNKHGKKTGDQFEAKGATKIGSSCWLGVRVLQNSGTSIGQNTIIGAHGVVTADIPADAIVVGQPAKLKRYRNSRVLCSDKKGIKG